jgi:hypothetical protein
MFNTNDLSSLTYDLKDWKLVYDTKKSPKGDGKAPYRSKGGYSMGTGSKRCQIREARYCSKKDA